MEFVKRGSGKGDRLVLFPGAWNPPTRAHMAMAHGALAWGDAVVFTLPCAFPHKRFEGADLQQRLEWLRRVAAEEDRFWVALARGGLFVEMAREARQAGAQQVLILCGADAAQRIIEWDYGSRDPIERQLEEYELLVAPRTVQYRPPLALAAHVHPLSLDPAWREVSSTEVRTRRERGEHWEHLVPECLVPLLR
jgi:nicotinic acid mononucleotide adenylyltransferase